MLGHMPESQQKDSELLRMLEESQPIMSSRMLEESQTTVTSRMLEESQPTVSSRVLEQLQPNASSSSSSLRVQKAFAVAAEPEMEEDEEDPFLMIRSTMNFLCEIWNPSKSMLQNMKMVVGFLQSYVLHQGKIDPNTMRMREARMMKDALMCVLESWKKKKKRGSSSACSLEDLQIFLVQENLSAVLAEDIMYENTYMEWLEDFKEYASRRHSVRLDVPTSVKSSAGLRIGDGMNALFTGIHCREETGDQRLSQYISQSENGRVQTVRTPGELGHSLIRLDLYEVRDILRKDKRDWWKHAKVRSQFLTSSPIDPKYQLLKQILDLAANDMIGLSGLRKESNG